MWKSSDSRRAELPKAWEQSGTDAETEPCNMWRLKVEAYRRLGIQVLSEVVSAIQILADAKRILCPGHHLNYTHERESLGSLKAGPRHPGCKRRGPSTGQPRGFSGCRGLIYWRALQGQVGWFHAPTWPLSYLFGSCRTGVPGQSSLLRRLAKDIFRCAASGDGPPFSEGTF